MTDNDVMLEAFKVAYHDRDYYPDTDEADDWWCEKLGTWKRAWDAATAAAYEKCATMDVPDPEDIDAVEGAWIYNHNGNYIDAYWDGIAACQDAIRARGGTDGQATG